MLAHIIISIHFEKTAYSGENTIDLDLDEVIIFVCQELQGYEQRQVYPWLHQVIQMRFLVQDTMSVSIIVEYK